jgi:hypothetical protein
LLHQLLDDEKDVSLLRFIKPEHAVGKDMENFYHEVFALLLSQTKSSPTNSIRTQPE